MPRKCTIFIFSFILFVTAFSYNTRNVYAAVENQFTSSDFTCQMEEQVLEKAFCNEIPQNRSNILPNYLTSVCLGQNKIALKH